MSKNYIRNLDGIRAISVLAVIFFHFAPSVFPNGYLGVDVFFILSGYLIIGKILERIKANNFSYLSFLSNRLHRLYPSYLLTILLSIVIGLVALSPVRLKDFLVSIVASLGYFSNMLFWSQSGYFDVSSEFKPLLHTWSLAVEEQFYLIIPFLLLFIIKKKLEPLKALTFLFSISLFSFLVCYQIDKSTAFYLLPFRLWELLLGGIISQIVTKKIWSFLPRPAFSGLLIILSIFLFSNIVNFERYDFILYLITTFVIGLILFQVHLNPQDSLPLLENKILVLIGKSSYVSYLLHWPFIVIYKIGLHKDTFTLLEIAGYTAALLVVSHLVTTYYENFFRKQKYSRSKIYKFVFASYVPILAVCYWGISNDGFIRSFNNEEIIKNTMTFRSNTRKITVKKPCSGVLKRKNSCFLLNDSHSKDEILIWGDSHAKVFGEYLSTIYRKKIRLITVSGCPPLDNIIRADSQGNYKKCKSMYQKQVKNYILSNNNIKSVILVGRWSLYADGYKENGVLQKATHFIQESSKVKSDTLNTKVSSREVLTQNFERVVNSFSQKKNVIMLKPVPELKKNGNQLIFMPDSESVQYVPSSVEHNLKNKFTNNMIDSIAKRQSNAHAVDLSKVLCSDNCVFKDKNMFFYGDNNHLNPSGFYK
ncbi:acyltransferase, partial [bacterium]|nr:acyltransferase [bacterium]